MHEFSPLIEQEARQRHHDRVEEAIGGGVRSHAPWQSRRQRLRRELRLATSRIDS